MAFCEELQFRHRYPDVSVDKACPSIISIIVSMSPKFCLGVEHILLYRIFLVCAINFIRLTFHVIN